ncbi:MAG: YicC/YloC family endoribonuclease [Planctomycetota bacterium]|jgi:uncharacterized protein (TIGR00255 family)|nr:YicC/YloC family endoribonuclease [Planctomycetota bacterium]MDP6938500.1 YicC/YloC family endoribonuclease [Planctomycetota bacterium]
MANALRSMTGFGAATVAGKGVSVQVEVRSVNHRHLQAKLRMPPDLGHLESQVDALVRKHLSRGAIQLSARVTHASDELPARVHKDVAAAYLRSLKALASELKLKGDLELADLVRLPGVVSAPEKDPDLGGMSKLVLRATTLALRDLVQMREEEGAAMAKDLASHAAAIAKIHKSIQRSAPGLVRRHQADLKRRVSELLDGNETVSSRDLAREMALLGDKLDVSEELSRLEAHLQQLDRLLAKGGAVGRKLDFLAQEFNREANTIGSKCNDARTAHAVVELKTQIERLREQVQNVE